MISITKPLATVLRTCFAAVAFAAWAALGPIHRGDIPAYWSPNFFLTIILGPLSGFFAWPTPPSASDYLFSILMTLALPASAIRSIRKPSLIASTLFVILTALWLLVGLGITYAWV